MTQPGRAGTKFERTTDDTDGTDMKAPSQGDFNSEISESVPIGDIRGLQEFAQADKL